MRGERRGREERGEDETNDRAITAPDADYTSAWDTISTPQTMGIRRFVSDSLSSLVVALLCRQRAVRTVRIRHRVWF